MSDIVNELRTGRGLTEGVVRDGWVHAKMQEAADLIAALRAEVASKNEQFQQYERKMDADMNALAAQNEKLRAALTVIANGSEVRCDDGSTEVVDIDDAADVARAALSPAVREGE